MLLWVSVITNRLERVRSGTLPDPVDHLGPAGIISWVELAEEARGCCLRAIFDAVPQRRPTRRRATAELNARIGQNVSDVVTHLRLSARKTGLHRSSRLLT